MNAKTIICSLILLLLCGNAQAQHLWWNLEKQTDATCVYGEITVLASHPAIYYCGANWHPGEAAGGYCGIQHNAAKERRTIFSIWDTSPTLHPKVTAADSKTVHNRFGGEGEGGHTHMLWDWKEGETFQFFVQKRPAQNLAQNPDEIDARYYIFDPKQKKWLHVATITSPKGGKNSVVTIGGGLNSFLENFLGKDREIPKIALYRLWLGTSLEKMKCLTQAVGDGTWGQLHDAYFLAEGDSQQLNAVFSKLEKEYGKPVFGEKGKKLEPLSDKALPDAVIDALKHLPKADDDRGSQKTSTAFTITTKKSDDRIETTTDADSVIFDIKSPSGIGGAMITTKNGKWPTTIILCLHLGGLESFSVSNGKVKLVASVLSHSGNTQRLYLTEDGKDGERKSGTKIKVLDAAGKPVNGLPGKDGYFEITLPKTLLESQPKSLEVAWIDFYRV